jgi:hypothetical protein
MMRPTMVRLGMNDVSFRTYSSGSASGCEIGNRCQESFYSEDDIVAVQCKHRLDAIRQLFSHSIMDIDHPPPPTPAFVSFAPGTVDKRILLEWGTSCLCKSGYECGYGSDGSVYSLS